MDLDLDRGSDRQREQHLKVGKHLTGFALSPVDAVGSVDLVKVVLRFWGNDSRVEMRPGLARRARRERSGDGRAEGSGSRCVRALAAQPSWGCPHPTGVRGADYTFTLDLWQMFLKWVVQYQKRTKLVTEAISLTT